jgi:CSLREA domain-containing protein
MKAGILLLVPALLTGTVHGDDALLPADMAPAALQVDRLPNGVSSNGNSILEAGETVVVEPAWRNTTAGPLTPTGSASAFQGAGAPGLYTIPDAFASYGTIAAGQTASCAATGDCYRLSVAVPGVRPQAHWDATFGEITSTGSVKTWMAHIGETFTDVPLSSPFYRFVETLVHNGITGGCTGATYCPTAPVSREQLAVFALVAKEGPYYIPPACIPGGERFADVPATSPYCRFIEELARRGVVGGCVVNGYCFAAPVSREQMAVFMVLTKEGAGYQPVPCLAGAEVFADVPASSPFCRWIEELARRGIVSGCGGGNYCPTAPVSREQMAVFVTATFGLAAYGPAPYMSVVNSTNDVDDGACSPSHCSLREALIAANGTPNATGARDEIRFAIPGAGPHVIRPTSAFPAITDALVVDGYSQPGATPNTLTAGSNAVLKIELDLSSAGAIGVSVAAPDVLLRGLAVNRAAGAEIALDSTRAAIEGCFIGTDAGGAVDLGPEDGIVVNSGSHQNRIGGTAPVQRNLVSGNRYGIIVAGSNANLIQGNLIGTDRSGNAPLPNASAGIGIVAAGHLLGSADNVVGGPQLGAGNVISANTGAGVWLSGFVGASLLIVSNTRIQANRIGESASGAPLPNVIGVDLNGSGVQGTLIGGGSGGFAGPAGNAIVATDTGVRMSTTINGGPKASQIRDNQIRGGQYGIAGSPSSPGEIASNAIGPNAVSGVFLEAGSAEGTSIRCNGISGHAGLGIDLAPVGVNPNDPGDGDTGPNALQNFPVITSAVASPQNVVVNGTLNSRPSTMYRIDLFLSNAPHPSGFGEGQACVNVLFTTTDAAGNASFSQVVPVIGVPPGRVVTATATDPAGNTSEFSAARLVQ